ncbi:iron complex outermembrane recepter protein [Salegentibacter echinorum]|uniref:Iron complex outermembrane recepter protein n=1 Tax=Salegentibacter echinorum TaxID=1073325 RepID=A0A1M5CUU7_SALEC|nr:TonB-dependent receptor [Salegentibacter echinorum]SHF58162.1 iron complex outermembrane recepter protein [Salegentibacter echinorum]
MKTIKPVFSFKEILTGCFCYVFLACIFTPQLKAQEKPADSLDFVKLNEVVLISANKKLNHNKQQKPLSSLDEFLESSQNINMVKRGAYAWEPNMNNMSSERLVVTIDGMQIFGACTDKMDPITSYVDVSNLAEASVESGQKGNAFGNTIGGSIDLKLDKSNFRPTGWTSAIESSFETNNNLRVFGGEANYSNDQFYFNFDAIYRKANNYKAGDNKEVNYSQFEKYNFSLNTGYKLSNNQSLNATLIYDRANDVGYPALSMDVSLARAVIASLSYNQDTLGAVFSNWESKVYYNDIKHVMDDTKRPDVAMHMDMPGWSETFGFYSKANLNKTNQKFLFKVDGFYNKSLAEMTMYPNDSEQPAMFMLTWPDVRTANLGIYGEDFIYFNTASLKLSTRLAYHSNTVADNFGLNSLKIFYPEMEKTNTRLLKSFSATYLKRFSDLSFSGGLSYGERAPSVSEGYGFYLFNSFDNHDYIGNPNLNTERSAEANLTVTYRKPAYEITAEAKYFHIYNYIIGMPEPSLSTMTMGADGVKVYTNLDYARLFNTSISGKYNLSKSFNVNGSIAYHRGLDDEDEDLPLISPVTYKAGLSFTNNKTTASIALKGAATQTNYNPNYGETKTEDYAIVSAGFGHRFLINNNDLYLKAGVENIFDTYYSTYNDWNNIPRMGRNFHLTISYNLN